MSTTTLPAENFIMVVPYNLFPGEPSGNRLRIEKLCYWNDGRCEHPVNEQTIGLFLRNADLYCVSIYPDQPQLGCYAMDNDLQPENGERLVHEIYYEGRIIYRNC